MSTLEERNVIERMINDYPLYTSTEKCFWTIESVKDLICHELGIEIATPTVTKYLHQWRLMHKLNSVSPELYTSATVSWFTNTFPMVKKKAKSEKAEIIKLEGIHRVKFPDNLLKKSKECPDWKIKNWQMKIIAPYGKKAFILSSTNFDAYDLIYFFENLIKNSDKKVYIVFNMKKLYPMKPLKEWLVKNKGKIEVYYVPR